MEPDLRDGQRCCEEVSPQATAGGGQGGLKIGGTQRNVG